MPEKYWAALHKRALLEAAEIVGLNSRPRVMVGLLAVVAALAALAFWGSADAARDETIVRIAIAFIVVAAASDPVLASECRGFPAGSRFALDADTPAVAFWHLDREAAN